MENNNSLFDEIRTLREELHQVVSFIVELKRDYTVLEEQIELGSSDVLRLLGISKASLARWRDNNTIPYRYISVSYTHLTLPTTPYV